MNKYFFLVILLLSVKSIAAPSRGNSGGKWSVSGYYGMGAINPSDLNNTSVFSTATPKPQNITSLSIFGGSIGYLLSSNIKFSVVYEQQSAKSSTRLTLPAVNDGGFEITQSNISGRLDYFLKNSGKLLLFIGGAAGYPLTSKVTAKSSTRTDYEAEKSAVYAGYLGANFNFSKNFGLFIEGGYQNSVMKTLKAGSTNLTKATGGNAQLDLSGAIGHAGLVVMF